MASLGTLLIVILLSFTPASESHPHRSSIIELLHGKTEKRPKEKDSEPSFHYYDHDEDSCSASPCRNHGQCTATSSGYHCQCNEFFTGDHCEKAIRRCTSDVCNHGECVLRKAAPHFRCRCDYPYHGPTCNTASDVCSSDNNPCKNEGVCTVRDNNSFRCVCPSYYQGTFCEIGPNDCYRKDGLQYRGQVSYTKSGHTCLPWDSYLLAKEAINSFVRGIYMFGIGEHNFCRNPDGAEKPWCYFQDDNGKLNWDLCDVALCKDPVLSSAPLPRLVTRNTTQPVVIGGLKSNATKVNATTAAKANATFATCGIKELTTNVHGRIFGGQRSQPGQHPWLASLQLKSNLPFYTAGHVCGGTLIGQCWILTAAHCVQPLLQPEIWRVFLGKVDLQKNETYQQSFDVERIIIHEQYREDRMSLHFDVALMALKKVNNTCAKESRFVKTACIVNRDFAVGKSCVIAGWGKTETGFTSQLLDAAVQLISQAVCSDPKRYGKLIDDSMLCAGVPEGGVDACQGDSGGPLICDRGGVSQLVGVVSWGEKCGVKDRPGVYASVYKLAQWIETKMKEK